MYEGIISKQPRLRYVENVKAPLPLLSDGEPYQAFTTLKHNIEDAVGYNFLGTLGDMFRTANLKVSKVGVAFNSIHKTGRAFDYDQNSKYYILVPETKAGKIYFTTWLKNDNAPLADDRFQEMYSHGQTVKVWQNGKLREMVLTTGRWFNFTQLAESLRWERIPAWKSWSLYHRYSTKMEFWHYQYMWHNGQRINFQMGMDLLRQPLNSNIIPTSHYSILRYGDNDADDGGMVTTLQTALHNRGFLRFAEIDGDFRKITQGAVMAFQKSVGLDADGVVGSKTWDALGV